MTDDYDANREATPHVCETARCWGECHPSPQYGWPSYTVSAVKIGAVIPISQEVLADHEDTGQDARMRRKLAWHRKFRTWFNWYNFRDRVGSWILPWDPYEE